MAGGREGAGRGGAVARQTKMAALDRVKVLVLGDSGECAHPRGAPPLGHRGACAVSRCAPPFSPHGDRYGR